jgi:hypothetical protein
MGKKPETSASAEVFFMQKCGREFTHLATFLHKKNIAP